MGEVFERAFKFYEQREKIVKEINTYRQAIPIIEQQMQPFQDSMSWKELELRMNDLKPEFFNQIGLTITYQVLKESLNECLRLEKSINKLS